MKISTACLERKKNQIIIADGSERSDYISMEHIFKKMGKIHDGVQLMKTYYPHDKSWSAQHKISEVTQKKDVNFAWDYEYEDYHPLDIFCENSNTLKEIEEVKQYGADLHLTLTLDISLSDSELRAIAEKLSDYGRIYLRINHEMNGEWFRYNTQHTYKEACDFFVRFHRIVKSVSPNIYTVFNIASDSATADVLVKDKHLHLEEDKLREALNVADYWSIDKYISLNYGWPFETVVTEESTQYFKGTPDDWWRIIDETYLKMIWHSNMKAKPLFINEFNSDCDVDGEEGQAKIIESIYNRLAVGEFEWLQGIVLYQFRDFGGLGLEKGDRKDYKEMPALSAYRNAIKKFPYHFVTEKEEWKRADYTFVWQDTDHIRGLCINDISSKSCFKNKFEFPVYLTWKDGVTWVRLNVGESLELKDLDEVYLFVPPYKDKQHGMMYSAMVREIKSELEDMVEE